MSLNDNGEILTSGAEIFKVAGAVGGGGMTRNLALFNEASIWHNRDINIIEA